MRRRPTRESAPPPPPPSSNSLRRRLRELQQAMTELPAVIETACAATPEQEAQAAAIVSKWRGAVRAFNQSFMSLIDWASQEKLGHDLRALEEIKENIYVEASNPPNSERHKQAVQGVEALVQRLCDQVSQNSKRSGLSRWFSGGGPSLEQAPAIIQELRDRVSSVQNQLGHLWEAFKEAGSHRRKMVEEIKTPAVAAVFAPEWQTRRFLAWQARASQDGYVFPGLRSSVVVGRWRIDVGAVSRPLIGVGVHKGIYFHCYRGNSDFRSPSVVLAEALEDAKKKEAELLQAIDEALDRERKEREKHGADDQTLAAAAAHFEKTRDLADTIKKRIRHQMHILPMCPYCGGPLGDEPNADHIYPVNRGGLSTAENMVYVCAGCNNKKRDKTLREFILAEGLNRDEVETRLTKLRKRF